MKHLGKSFLIMLLGLTALLASGYGCSKAPDTFINSTTDSFVNDGGLQLTQASQLLQADYLFVVDYSYSMSESRDNLFDNMGLFSQYLAAQGIDYRVGFVKGTTHAGSVSTIANKFMTNTLTPASLGTLSTDILSVLETAGTPLQENRNYSLEAADRTLAAQGSSFLRASARLVYVFVTDSDHDPVPTLAAADTAAEVVPYYTNKLKAYKTNPSKYVSARAIVAGDTSGTVDGFNVGCVTGELDGIGSQNITKTAKAVDQNGSNAVVVRPVCGSFQDALQDVAENVSLPTDRFTLQSKFLNGSLQVYVNGALQTQGVDFNYLAGSNEIVFTAGHIPPFSATLKIVYQTSFVLSKTPAAESSIEVRVNNQVVPQSSTNGWSYVASENRIAFNGSAVPADDAAVQVLYQPK